MKDFLLTADAALMAGEPILLNPWFLVRGGRVTASGQGEPPRPEGVVPTVKGGWAVEPVADVHVHLFLAGTFDTDERRAVAELPREAALTRILELLRTYRRSGIAVVRDGGDPHGLALDAAAIAAERPDLYARVLPSGESLFAPGAQSTFFGTPLADADEAAERVEALKRAGATQVKVLATGLNSLDKVGRVEGNALDAKTLAAIADSAREAGLPLMVHANGPLGALLAIRPATVEHGFWLDPERDLPALAAAGSAWTPTRVAWSSLLAHPTLPEEKKAVVAATDERQRELVRLGGETSGLTILPGSDSGTPGVEHVGGFFREVAALAEAGVPPESTLTASAAFARAMLGKGAEGLRVGDVAGFSLYEGPLTEMPRSICLGGAWAVNVG